MRVQVDEEDLIAISNLFKACNEIRRADALQVGAVKIIAMPIEVWNRFVRADSSIAAKFVRPGPEERLK